MLKVLCLPRVRGFAVFLGGLAMLGAPDATLAQGDGSVLEEIIVTARKRDESLQSIPLSVTPFSAEQIQRRGFFGLEDIAQATAGFTYEGFISSSNSANAVIRGVANTFATARLSNVSFFLDGVYLQRQSMLNLGMIDMERVEVVKGPQNALYGRNAFAGAVNYVTKKPSEELDGYLLGAIGTDERYDYRASISGPITPNKVLLGKFTYGYTEYDGHTKNNHPFADANPPGPNSRKNLGGWEDEVFSLALTFQPTENLSAGGSFYKAELIRETQPGYGISGLGAQRFGFRSVNDLNCNAASRRHISGQFNVSGNTVFCGELPKFASDLPDQQATVFGPRGPMTVTTPARSSEGIVIDPRSVGLVADTKVATFDLNWDINDNFSLTYQYGFTDHKSNSTGGPGADDPLVGSTFLTNQNTFASSAFISFREQPASTLEADSHELRLSWTNGDNLSARAGLYYSEVEDTEDHIPYFLPLCNANNPAGCNMPISRSTPSPFVTEATAVVGVTYLQGFVQHGASNELTEFEDEVFAVFGDVEYQFNDQWGVTFEWRYTEEDKEVRRLVDSQGLRNGEVVTFQAPRDPVFNPLPPFLPPLRWTFTGLIDIPEDSEKFSYFTPRLIMEWTPNDNHLIYASAAKGVKAGGFNNALDHSQQTFAEEENITIELGSKNTFLDGQLVLNGAVYFIDWKDIQGSQAPIIASLTASDPITNIGDATSIGVEVDLNWLLTDRFFIDLVASYNDPEYDNTIYSTAVNAGLTADPDDTSGNTLCDDVVCPADGNVDGNTLARTSKAQVSGGLNYRHHFANGWVANARLDGNYQSKQFVTPINQAYVPGRFISNLSLSLAGPEHWELNIWGRNIFDKDYVSSSFHLGIFNRYLAAKGARSSWGANIKYNF